MKRILTMLLAVLLAVSVCPMTASAAPAVTSGDCSEAGDGSVTWKVENGTLTISGPGKMKGYGPSYFFDGEEYYESIGIEPEGLVPWYHCHPTKAVIAADVVSLGDYDSWGGTFWDNAELESFEVEEGNSRYSVYDDCLYVEAHVYEYDKDQGMVDTGKIEHTLFAIPPAKKGRLDIQEGTVNVALYSSWGFLAPCTQLTSIHFPSTWWPDENGERMIWAWGHSDHCYTYSMAPITSFTVADGNPNVRSIDGSIYTKDGSTLLMAPTMPENDELIVADGTREISSYALPRERERYTKAPLKITIPRSVTQAGTAIDDDFVAPALEIYDPTVGYPYGSAVVYGYTGTEAERAAKEDHVAFVDLAAYRPTVGGFNDVFESDWYGEAVSWAVKAGIVYGTSSTTFSPKANCTHDHILTFLWRAAGGPGSTAELPFTPKNDWAADALCWAYEKGMIDSSYDEQANCTSADAASYIWQAKGKPAAGYDGRFTDVPADADYAQAVAWALDAGVTYGTSATTFGPDSVCSRGRIATFLFRAYSE